MSALMHVAGSRRPPSRYVTVLALSGMAISLLQVLLAGPSLAALQTVEARLQQGPRTERPLVLQHTQQKRSMLFQDQYAGGARSMRSGPQHVAHMAATWRTLLQVGLLEGGIGTIVCLGLLLRWPWARRAALAFAVCYSLQIAGMASWGMYQVWMSPNPRLTPGMHEHNQTTIMIQLAMSGLLLWVLQRVSTRLNSPEVIREFQPPRRMVRRIVG
jgi:hypothetical protein